MSGLVTPRLTAASHWGGHGRGTRRVSPRHLSRGGSVLTCHALRSGSPSCRMPTGGRADQETRLAQRPTAPTSGLSQRDVCQVASARHGQLSGRIPEIQAEFSGRKGARALHRRHLDDCNNSGTVSVGQYLTEVRIILPSIPSSGAFLVTVCVGGEQFCLFHRTAWRRGATPGNSFFGLFERLA